MKTGISIIAFLCAMPALLCAQDAVTTGCPLGLVVVADGNADEWPMDWTLDEDKAIDYNVCGDDINLYIRLRVKSESARRKLASYGFTVWMDPNGKKKRKLGLKFPTGAEAKERFESMGERDMSRMSTSEKAELRKELNKKLVTDLEMMELIGLSDEPLTSTRSGITNGIKVAIAVNAEDDYIYEAIIPFKSFRISKSAVPILGIGFETGRYVPPSSKQANSQTTTSGMTRRGYGGYGGGQWQGGGSQGGARYSEMQTATSVWTSLKIK